MQAQGVGTPAPPEVAPPPVAPPEPVHAPLTPPGVAPSAVPAPMAASRAATKTIFGIPTPSMPEGFTAVSPQAEPAAPVAASGVESETGRTDRITKAGARKTAIPAPEIGPASTAPQPVTKEVGRTTSLGFDRNAPSVKRTDKVEKAERLEKAEADRTQPSRAPARPASRQAPILTYVGVGFAFGLVLLGIYELVGRLAH
jgi:hypothetical protein